MTAAPLQVPVLAVPGPVGLHASVTPRHNRQLDDLADRGHGLVEALDGLMVGAPDEGDAVRSHPLRERGDRHLGWRGCVGRLRTQQRQEDACGGEAQHHHETVLVRIAVPGPRSTRPKTRPLELFVSM